MKKYRLVVVVASLAAATACRKKEVPAAGPSLSAPDKAFPSADGANATPSLKPEAEVTATTEPIQLTFRLYQKTVKAKASALDTALWGQIELKNVGKNKYLIQDEIFYEPRHFNDVSEHRGGIYVEIIGSAGKPVKVYREWRDEIRDDNPPASPRTPEQVEEDKKIDAMLADWRKQGLSIMAIRDRLLNYTRSRPNLYEKEKWDRRYKDPHALLLPGQSTTTVALARSAPISPDSPAGISIGQFTELKDYALEPGHYRIRAVYDCAPSGRKKSKYPPLDFEVRVETPYIPFEVVR